jgi:hypothetical protein
VSNNADSVVRYDQLADRWLIVVPVFSRPPDNPQGPYAMCYAVSATPDPLGPYYRYEFQRPLFPDYPRPAIWPDGYYNPTSTSDLLPEVITQKHDCIADRNKMLKGLPATEQCVVIDGGVFMLNADVDGKRLPPPGAPNQMSGASSHLDGGPLAAQRQTGADGEDATDELHRDQPIGGLRQFFAKYQLHMRNAAA